MDTKVTKDEIKEFLTLNRWTNSYCKYIIQEEDDYNPFEKSKDVNLEKQDETLIQTAKHDILLMKDRQEEFDKRKELRLGDFILLPNGEYVKITHIWDDGQVQTGGGGSYYISKGGYLSMSGGLDHGLNAKDLILTKKTKKGIVWMFHESLAGGNRAVYSKIDFRVYKTRKGADLSGIPQSY